MSRALTWYSPSPGNGMNDHVTGTAEISLGVIFRRLHLVIKQSPISAEDGRFTF